MNIDNTALQTLTNTESSGKALTLTVEKKGDTEETETDVKAKFELKALLGGEPVFKADDEKTNGTIAVSINYKKLPQETS